MSRAVRAAVQGAAAPVADIAAVVELGAVIASRGNTTGVALAETGGRVARLAGRAITPAMESAAAAVADIAAVVEERAILAGDGLTGRVTFAQAGRGVTDFVGAAVGPAMQGAAALVANVAAIIERRAIGAQGEARAGCVADTQIVDAAEIGATGRAAVQRAAAAVADQAAAILATGWVTSQGRARRRHALAVGAGVAIDTTTAVDAIAAAIPDGAAVATEAAATGDRRDACRSSLAQVVLARPSRLAAIAAGDGSATAVPQLPTAILAAGRVAGGRGAAGGRNTQGVGAHLAGGTSAAA